MEYDNVIRELNRAYLEISELKSRSIRMRLICPECFELHIDEGESATKPHHTHQCAECGMTWRPAVENTVGVRFLWEQGK
jgi:hypothetical protein